MENGTLGVLFSVLCGCSYDVGIGMGGDFMRTALYEAIVTEYLIREERTWIEWFLRKPKRKIMGVDSRPGKLIKELKLGEPIPELEAGYHFVSFITPANSDPVAFYNPNYTTNIYKREENDEWNIHLNK